MITFPLLLKEIRKEAYLTQAEFAKILGVSPILIAMIESGQKEVSKNFILRLADCLRVHPSSITPFLFFEKTFDEHEVTGVEKYVYDFGSKMQKILIKDRAKKLKV